MAAPKLQVAPLAAAATAGAGDGGSPERVVEQRWEGNITQATLAYDSDAGSDLKRVAITSSTMEGNTWDGSVCVADVSGEGIAIRNRSAFPCGVSCVAWAAKDTLVVGMDSGEAKLLRVTPPASKDRVGTLSTVTTMSGHDSGITAVAAQHGSRKQPGLALTGSADGIIHLWDAMRPSEPLATFHGHSDAVTGLAWLPDAAGRSSYGDRPSRQFKAMRDRQSKSDPMASAARFLMRKHLANKRTRAKGRGSHAMISADVNDVTDSAIRQTEELADRLGLSVSECVSRWDSAFARADASRRAGNPVEDLLAALARLGAAEACQKLFSWAESHDVVLRERAYLAVLQAQAAGARGPESARLCWDMVHRMREHGIVPTAHTYNVLLTIAARTRPVDRSTLSAIRKGMADTGIEPTHITYLMLISAYGRLLPKPDLESAKDCFKKLMVLEEEAPVRVKALQTELQQLPAAERALDAALDAWVAAGGDPATPDFADQHALAGEAEEVARLSAEVERWQERVAELQAVQARLQDIKSSLTPRSFSTKRIAMASVAARVDPPDVAMVEELLAQLEAAGQPTDVVQGLLATAADQRAGDSILQVRNWLRSLTRDKPRGRGAAKRIHTQLMQRLRQLVAEGRWDPLEVEKPLTVIMGHLAKLHMPQAALEVFLWMQESEQGVVANRFHLSPVLKCLAQARVSNSAEMIESAIDRFCAAHEAAKASEANASSNERASDLLPDVVHFTYLLTAHSRRTVEEVVDGRSTWARDPNEPGIWRAIERMAAVGVALDDRAVAVVLRAMRWRQGGAASLLEAKDALERARAMAGAHVGASSRLELLELAALDPRGAREVEAQMAWFRESARAMLPSAQARLASARRHAGDADRPATNVKDSWSRRLAVPTAVPSLPYKVDRSGGRSTASGQQLRLGRRVAAAVEGGADETAAEQAAEAGVEEAAPAAGGKGGMRPVLRLLRSVDK